MAKVISKPSFPNSGGSVKYNPHMTTSDLVLDTLVERETLLKKLTRHVLSQKNAVQARHAFFHGPRGIGKTTMLLALRFTLEAKPGVMAAFDIVQFSEEERRIANLPAFAIRLLERLSKEKPHLEQNLDKARSNPPAALGILLDAAEREPRQTVLLIDNFDEIAIAVASAKRKSDGATKKDLIKAFKRFLACPRFIIVATAIQNPGKRKKFQKEFLKYFDPVVALPTLNDPISFIRKRAQKDRRKDILKSLPDLAPLINGLNRLADGAPRPLVFLYNYLPDMDPPDFVEIILRIIDDLTPMHQDVIDLLLNRGQAAVLEMLADRGGVGNTEDIANLTFQDKDTARAALNDLSHLGMVVRDIPGISFSDMESPGRETVFRVHPPLFQIWYELRHLGSESGLSLIRFFSLLNHPAIRATTPVSPQKTHPNSLLSTPADPMTDVVDMLDPSWEEIKRKYVDETLKNGRSLRDALELLSSTMDEEGLSPTPRRVGLLIVRAAVKQLLGEIESPEADLEAAMNITPDSDSPRARARLQIAWSRFLALSSNHERALEAALKGVELSHSISSDSTTDIQAVALLSRASFHIAQTRFQDALNFIQKAENTMDDKNDGKLKWRSLNLRGILDNERGNFHEAGEWHGRALALAQHAEYVEVDQRCAGTSGGLFSIDAMAKRRTEI